MTLIVSTPKRQFELPTEGIHWARLVEIQDLGVVQFKSESKEKIVFYWETTDEVQGQGRGLRASQRFSKTLHPKGKLRAAVRVMIGKDPGDTFDLSVLIGTVVQVLVKHNESGGITYANVTEVIRPKPSAQSTSTGMAIAPVAGTTSADSHNDDSLRMAAKAVDEMISADSSR